MENLLMKLLLLAALAQFGISVSQFATCRGWVCAQMFEKRARDILRVEWKPISVFPEETKRFIK